MVPQNTRVDSEIVNALSVDVEEYFHAEIFHEAVRGVYGRDFPSRVEASVARILELLADRRTQATFFVLGEVAAAHPAMIRKIAGEGHEIGCHSYRHEPVFRRTPDEFRADIRRAKALLEDLTGHPVIGYRAPNFSIGRGETWAYDALLGEGFRYDSSTYPILHDRYGDPGAPRFPHPIPVNGEGTLMEFPIGTLRVLGVNLPIGGGGYFRLFPLELIRRAITHVSRHEKAPIMFYFHPWELDADQPRVPMPWHRHLRHYTGLQREEAKLSSLLRHIRFTTARTVLGLS